jgi:hypothetical protein
MPIVVGNGIDIGNGITITGGAGGGGGTPGIDNVFGYFQLDPPITPGYQLQDPTATVNGSVGFTIDDDNLTGVAVTALTVSNDNWITTNYTTIPGTYTCTWGPGSTVASSSILVVQASGPFVFFIQGQSGPATYNYPFVLSV